MSSEEQLKTLFSLLGLSEQKCTETIKNSALSKRLETITNEAIKNRSSFSDIGKLYYHFGSKLKPQQEKYAPLVVKYISEQKLNTVQRIDAALQFLSLDIKETVDLKAFEEYCGVGIVITLDEIKACVDNTIEKYRNDIGNKRFKVIVMQEVQEKLKWAEGRLIVEEVNNAANRLLNLSRRSSAGSGEGEKKKKDKKNEKSSSKGDVLNSKIENDSDSISILKIMKKLNFHKPGENFKTDGYVVTENTERLLKEHLAVTKGKVRTRFPPEPNGILHIGHAKAININFGYAAAHNGICFLRYDDTNPEKEEEKFFISIQQMVEWLGYKPYKITHSSDYFDKLYEMAVQLIKKDLAYVCHQKHEEIKGFNPPPSPWRDRPIEENLFFFECMKNGMYGEGEATLRMKVVLEEGKQDPVAYRIKYLPHPRSRQKWCIYPTYDYTHCLCDSIENITHSLCTKEFQSRRSTYYWLCNALDVYCPVQWEYGRLNMNYTVISKRKIAKLITNNIIKDWDDPRLFTLPALKRRGFPSEAVNRFCAKIGVTGAEAVVDPQMLESEVRSILNDTAIRTMVVTEPLKVTIVNFPVLKVKSKIDVPDFPNQLDRGSHEIYLNEVIYIEQSDFKSVADNRYRRLTLEQTVGLRYAGIVIRVKVVEYDKNEQPSELKVTAEKVTTSNKPKAFIHWVSNPVTVELRLYDRLFYHKNPEDSEIVKEGFLSDVNLKSLKVLNGHADASLTKLYKSSEIFQFERIGFFCRDPDSTNSLFVFNRTITLKEDSGKNSGS